jgi:Zn finger protein HypA/HybF involved in hydrogenase expression
MEELQYELECILCHTKSTVIVVDEEEPPAHCPMCGSEAIEVEEIEID